MNFDLQGLSKAAGERYVSFKSKAEILKPKHSYDLQAVVSAAYYKSNNVFCT